MAVKNISSLDPKVRKKVFKAFCIIVSAVLLISTVVMALYSCNTQGAAFDSANIPVDWEVVIQQRKWKAERSSSAEKMNIDTLKFFKDETGSWSVVVNTSEDVRDSAIADIDNENGSFVFNSEKYTVHLSKMPNGSFMLRLRNSANAISDFYN